MEEKILQEYIKNITKASTYFIFKNGPVKKLQEEGKLTAEEVKEMQVYMQNHLAYLYNVLLDSIFVIASSYRYFTSSSFDFYISLEVINSYSYTDKCY